MRKRKIERLPYPIPGLLRSAKTCYRMATASGRVLPFVILAGVQKGGTTSLYQQLRSHPNVQWAVGKGTHYFDLNFDRGLRWYRSCFPHGLHISYRMLRIGSRAISAESCGYYFDHPLAAARCAETLPDARVVIMLRNPIDRAYSHYHDSVSKGFESLPFEEAIEREAPRIAGEAERITADPSYYSAAHRQLSYLSRGVYIDHIQRWMEAYPREQVLVLKSEAFYADMAAEYLKVLRFIGLPRWQPAVYETRNVAQYAELSDETRRRLKEFYRPHNHRLYDFLGVDFGWE